MKRITKNNEEINTVITEEILETLLITTARKNTNVAAALKKVIPKFARLKSSSTISTILVSL
jgi:hypothetical protein